MVHRMSSGVHDDPEILRLPTLAPVVLLTPQLLSAGMGTAAA